MALAKAGDEKGDEEVHSLRTPVNEASKELVDTPVKKTLYVDIGDHAENHEAASLPKQAKPTNPEKLKQEDADFKMNDGEGINGMAVKKKEAEES